MVALGEEFVTQAAEELIQRYLALASNGQVPVDLDALARLQGCRVDYTPLPRGSHGLLIPAANGFVIKVNSAEFALTRSRFTVAHEIAHTFFYSRDRQGRPNKAILLKHDDEERLCDLVAGLLTVPTPLLLRAVRVVKHPGVGTVVGIAKRFGVSTEVAARRLKTELRQLDGLGFCEWVHEDVFSRHRRVQLSPNPNYEPFVLSWLVAPELLSSSGPPRGTRLRKGTILSDVLAGSRRCVAGEMVQVGQKLVAKLGDVAQIKSTRRVERIIASISELIRLRVRVLLTSSRPKSR